ncbi:ABC transporter ATP-binding protein [Lutibacter sp. B1]|uniref:ABC transporter ATP-binding protein n=1 Tax=Lutibacter sp. B1 TaxID=2725996 RepID=UPI0014568875|nr:ABC transporter ATP-binding protein [Lutibacter sp. B1]NLP58172.1 ABC transporter ATP-binding protein [Lutibacter sp. B1]
MNEVILKIENLSKQYRLGLVGTGTLSHDLKRWWYKVRGKEDPFLKIGDTNDRATKGTSDYVWALKDINLEVQKGEVLGIIGKNGAGKSTLLKILSKITSPTTGSVKSKGRIASLLEVGTGFHGELTGRENIFLNGTILGMTKAEITQKYDEIVEFSGCERYIDTPVKRYSSGMTVRLAFAVAAFLEPDILIIDEVLAVGDAEFQKKAIGKMKEISKGDGRTVLFVSHNMAAVQNLCERGIVLKKGSIVFDGGVEQAISSYLAEYYSSENKIIDFPVETSKLSIENINIVDVNEQQVSNLILGSFYNFQLFLRSKKDLRHVNVRLQVFDENNHLITTLNTFHTNNVLNISENESVVLKCCMEKLAIAPGKYTLGIEIFDLFEKSTIYENEKVLYFTIENGDYFASGRLPSPQNIGKCLVEFAWKLNYYDIT